MDQRHPEVSRALLAAIAAGDRDEIRTMLRRAVTLGAWLLEETAAMPTPDGDAR